MVRDILVTSGARVYSALVAMAVLTISARWLGPEGRGVVVVISTWVALFATVSYLSLGQVCVHRAATNKDLSWLGPAFSALLMITAAVSIAGWFVAAGLYVFAKEQMFGAIPPWALALGMVALPFFVWEQYASALLSIVNRVSAYNLNQIVSRTLGLIMTAGAIVWLDLGVVGFLLAFVVTQGMIAFAGVNILRRQMRGRLSGGISVMPGLIKDGLKLHLNSIGVLLFSGIDILMLNYFRGPAEAAIFQLPMQLFIAILMVPQSALLVLNAKVSGLDSSSFWRVHRRVMLWLIGLLTAASPVLWLIAPWLIPQLAGNEFSGSIGVFQILLIGVPGAVLNTLMAIQWTTRGYFMRASLLTFVSGLANVLINIILIPRYGAQGAATATVVGLYLLPVTANLVLAIFVERKERRGKRGNGPICE
jgi:O-antigen/teichoic acid export membrane protein